MNIRHSLRIVLWASAVPLVTIVAAQGPTQKPDPLGEPFKGVTTHGTVAAGLFPVRSTGVSTAPVRNAAVAFLRSLSPDERAKTAFAADDIEWRKWNNIHRYVRQGVSFKEMSEEQRARAFDLLGAGLSAKGLEKSRNIMRLNETIAEMTKRFDEYGEGLYHLTVMGEPSDTQPWGWQLDGHHLVLNYFVLRDQVVMTPAFMGSEPIRADAGKYAGTTVLQDEQNKGLALMQALTPEQQKKATLQPEKTANNSLAQAFRDNLVLDYAGLRAQELTAAQRQLLVDLVGEYVGNMAQGHAKVRMDEVRKHLDDTYFAWIGATGADAVFYYRIHSPVILIEFDHQTPVALPGPKVPGRIHVHSVVRTPNGNDYGKDLLRQHYAAAQNDPAHGHQR
jgi:predicted nuclease of restriction endonuclease-like (RecB) superfamily